MDLIGNLALGLATALSPTSLLYCFIGALLGTLIGVLPGVGPTATIAMLLPITFSLEPVSALIMLAGIYYGASYGGSTTAILLNLPGESSGVITALDGYQMARQGRAAQALAIAAIGSFIAGTIATLIIALFAPPLGTLALKFGSVEYFSLMVLGLMSSVALARGSVVNAIAMVVLGLLFGMVGTDIYTGMQRFTFGFMNLYEGLSIVAVAVGVFGIAEIIRNLEGEDSADAPPSLTHVSTRKLLFSLGAWRPAVPAILRGTAVGSVLGMLPGGGATLASFASYAIEKKISRHPERFGTGIIEGVAAPESANNAAAQSSFIPMLTLGLPGNPVMAMMLGALLLQGIVPGPNLMVREPDLFWGVIVSMWIGNAMLLILNLPLVGLWVKLLSVPYAALFPAIIIFSAIGVFSVASNPFDLMTISIFGIVGYVFAKLDCEPAPLMLGFILGPMLEEHLRRAMLISRGDPSVFLTHPISAAFLAVAAVLLIVACLPAVLKTRQRIFVDD